MTFLKRAIVALFPFAFLAPLSAQAQDCTIRNVDAGDQPQYAKPDDPWIYRGTDIPVDDEWLMGELPNGLKYAVRSNGVPPCQISMRVHIDAGSLHEEESERGYAHLIEHLVFRESRDFGPDEALRHFQRLGAGFGSDTNATTGPVSTIFKLALPNANYQTLDDSVRQLAGMVREPALSSANLAKDIPIVLAERRDQSGPSRRIDDATMQTLFAGQRIANRSPIGTVKTLEAATPESVRAFHTRWYRPENATVVLVGDADRQLLATLVERYFADWKGVGPVTPAPDFGAPNAPTGADPANPVGEVAVVVEPGQARNLIMTVNRPYVQVIDNLEYNRGWMLDAVAAGIVSNRLEKRARTGGSYLAAGVALDKVSRSADITYISITPLTADWQQALSDVRGVIADALVTPPSQQEIDQVVAQFDVNFVNGVEQSRIQAGGDLADTLVGAVDIREAVASPETFLEVFRSMKPRFTPETLLQHTRDIFDGEVIRAVYLTSEAGEANQSSLRAALLQPAVISAEARDQGNTLSFADLPPIGVPADPVLQEPLGVLGVEKLTFANGVRALLMGRSNEPGRVTVKVRFGGGWRAIAPEEAVYAELADAALMASGMAGVGLNDFDSLLAGRKLGLDFAIEDGTFVFQGMTRQEDLADQLYLFAAKLALPRWEANPVERAKASAVLGYDSYDSDPNGVLTRDLDWLLHDRDPRFATATPEQIRTATPAGFEKVWSRLLSEGPVEVQVFGDIDRAATIEALSRTFGALPPRAPLSAQVLARGTSFPAGTPHPVRLVHSGEGDQAAAMVAWPTGGGVAGLPESRKLEVLAQVFSNKLLDALRERAGAAYAPFVSSNWPVDTEEGGFVFALVQVQPELVPVFFAEAQKIADDLAANGPSEDDLARAVEPYKNFLARAQTGHMFWLSQLEGSASDPRRIEQLYTLFSDYAEVTPEQMRALAQKYLLDGKAFKLEVMPTSK